MKDLLLKKLNCFKDPKFDFDPEAHRYTYDGEEYTSVTKFIQRFHKPFDKDYWSNKKAKELGVTQESILNDWKEKNDHANRVGTELHEWIEDFFNQKWRQLPTDLEVIDLINKFNVIYAQKLHKLQPLAYEVRVFSKKLKIAGMIDSLFIYRDKLFILDWKTNKNFTTDENLKYKEPLYTPFESFNKSHHAEYSIQLSLYALILEEWGFKIGGSYLVHFGRGENPAKIYDVIDMRQYLKKYFSEL